METMTGIEAAQGIFNNCLAVLYSTMKDMEARCDTEEDTAKLFSAVDLLVHAYNVFQATAAFQAKAEEQAEAQKASKVTPFHPKMH
jgi:hypothetical protein